MSRICNTFSNLIFGAFIKLKTLNRHDLNFYRFYSKNFLRVVYFCFLVSTVILIVFFISTNLDYAKEVVVVNESISPTVSETVQFTMLDKIKEGRELLRKSSPLEYETKYYTLKRGVKIKTGDLVRKQVALAVLNKNTGEVFEQRFWVKEQDIKNYKKTKIINVQLVSSGADTGALNVNWWNSFNSDYSFPDKQELIVVANKYLFPSKYLSGLPEKTGGQYTDIVYVPYSKKLHLSEIVEAGKKYLEKNIEQAFIELEAAKVKSRSLPGALITDGISRDLLRNIMVVEHIDPDGFRSATDGGQELSERVLTIIGANQEYAYRYTGSPAGASGLAQFIQPTYKNMVSKYPEAKMIKDYNAGMANHSNAVKAMVLFFDSHKKEISNKITRKEIAKPLGISEDMLAATYNGGPGRVVKAVNKLGLAWFTSQLKLSRANQIMRQETLNYVKKFQAVKSLNLFANISGG